MLSVFVEYSIDAAHFLPMVPEGHKCGRMHGHRYDIRIEIGGLVGQSGWIMDYADIRLVADPVVMSMDHRTINDIISNPTCENIVLWIVSRLTETLPGLCFVEVRETEHCGCVWRR